jgi:dTMP kinase
MNKRGLLIAFEGGDGSGKSTQAAIAAERLGGVLTRQAGGTPFGARLRTIALEPAAAELSLRAEALLYMTDRAEHVQKVVEPALADGFHVISDRWAYSSFVYQGYGRGLDVGELRHIADWAMSGLWPDIVILLDIPLDVGAERRIERGAEEDHYELAGAELQRRVVGGYRDLAAADPDRWTIVDGTGDVDDVAARVWEVIEPHLLA